MAVYVDPLRRAVPREAEARRAGARSGHRWCHMMADTLDELHALAETIGLRREWFQGDHYDLVPFRRARAVALGAIETTTRDLVRLRQRNRNAAA
jgi:hypothetical protein